VTPALFSVYDELLCRASEPPFRPRADALREQFLRRTAALSEGENVRAVLAARRGAVAQVSSRTEPNPDEHAGPPEREARANAAWDEALTRGGLAAELAPGFDDPAERSLVRVLSRAQRGVFRLAIDAGRTTALDLVGGGSFLLLPRDDTIRAVPEATLEVTLFDGRIVAASDGCALLPGVVFHPPDALSQIERVVASARQKDLAHDEVCDALLWMQDAFVTLSRVKIAYAYNPEALSTRTHQESPPS
jgi:hypothetical protein